MFIALFFSIFRTLCNNQSEIENDEETIDHEITDHWMTPTPKSIKMEQPEQSYVTATADDLNSKDVNLIRIDGTEVFVVKTLDEENYSSVNNHTNSGNFVADTECELCYESLSMHRIELETDEDRQMYNVHEEYIQNVWKCCVENCMRNEHFKHFKHFKAHINMHIKVRRTRSALKYKNVLFGEVALQHLVHTLVLSHTLSIFTLSKASFSDRSSRK